MQTDGYPNVSVPVLFLDNDFRDPDLDRYLDKVQTLEPEVAVVGDADTRRQARRIQAAIDELHGRYDDLRCIAVPKCEAAFDVFTDDVVLGYPNGYSTVDPDDFSDIVDWRDNQLWILGGNPHSQHDVVQALTQPTLTDDPPANIVGVDGNGVLRAAYLGEYWTPDRYRRADHLSIRETVSHSLLEMKGYWQRQGMWPETTPLERYGPAVLEPDDRVYAASGGDIRTKNDLESAYVETYDDALTLAFESKTAQRFVEYREGWEEPCTN